MSQETTEDLVDLARLVVDHAESGEEVEAFAVRSTETQIEALNGQVDALSSAVTRGVGVRVVVDGRQGYASTAVVTKEGLNEALAEARSNAAVATPDEANGLPDEQPPADVGDLTRPGLAATPVEDKIRLALDVERIARETSPEVRGVDAAAYGDTLIEAALVSTRGLERTLARTDAWAYVFALASRDGETQTGLGVTIGRAPDELDVEAAGREGASRAVRLLGSKKPESRKVPVVLDPYAAAQFLGVLSGALSAEAVLKGRSLFADRLGDEVAASGLHLIDDGLRPDGPATAPWDGEGVPQQRTAIIDDGRLASYLHNTWTARRTGGDARSTGNASRGSFRSSPGVAPTNIYLEPGNLSASEVIARAGDGVYVQDVAGIHSGANPISGDFSVGVTGLAIRGGELAEPFREATAASTILEILRSIDEVGSDLRFYPFGGALGGSTVLVTEMSVAGR
jgi:PmbA protein